jgi:hypothetical protein
MGTVDWQKGANRWPDALLEKDADIPRLSQPAPAKLIVNNGRGIAIVPEDQAFESPIQVAALKKNPGAKRHRGRSAPTGCRSAEVRNLVCARGRVTYEC